MMSERRTACALGISGETLSAWRNRTLPEGEARRITRHVATCAACQSRLDQFARIAAALQRQSVPDLRAQTWRGLRARLAQKEHSSMPLRRAAFSGLGAIAAIAVVAALFVLFLSHRPGGNSVPISTGNAPTATATSAPPPACPSFPASYYSQIPDPHYTTTNVFANLPLPPQSRIVPNDASGGVRGYDICSPGTVASISSYMSAQLTALGWSSSGNGVWMKNGYHLTVSIPTATNWNMNWRDPDQQP